MKIQKRIDKRTLQCHLGSTEMVGFSKTTRSGSLHVISRPATERWSDAKVFRTTSDIVVLYMEWSFAQ